MKVIKIKTEMFMGLEMTQYSAGSLRVLETIDDYKDISVLLENFGTMRMPTGKYQHLSISHIDRYPTWEELKLIKDQLMGDNFAFQAFPPKSHYVNLHENTFHLFKIL